MRSLDAPTRDTVADLDVCIAHSKADVRPVLRAHRDEILRLFRAYTNERGWDFEQTPDLTHVPDAVRKALLRSYNLSHPKRVLRDLRADILAVPDNLCPYCRLEVPSTLDHFLPKSSHEPYAAFASNLVPMCRTCNTLKGTKGSKLARQFFTHAYFDLRNVDERFLVAQVSVGRRHVATNFVIDFSTTIDAEVMQRLAYQFSVLRLVQRYQIEAVDVIYEQATKLDAMDGDGCDEEDMRASLKGDAVTEEQRLGLNYWKAALLTALSDNRTFTRGGFRNAL